MISKVDYKFFDQAKKISETSDFKKAHVGCVAVYKGNVIAVGCSTNKTHPAQKYYNQFRIPEGEDVSMASIPKLHAEINCLNQLKHMNVNFAKVEYNSIYGLIKVSWKKNNNKVTLIIDVPANTKANFIYKDKKTTLLAGNYTLTDL